MRTLRTPLMLALALSACADGKKTDDTDVSDSDGTDTDVTSTLSVAIDPEDPMPGDDLKCEVDGYDGDVEFSWEVDGDDADIDEDEVDGELVDAYQTWRCTAEGEDGEEDDAEVVVGEACTSLRSAYYGDGVAWTDADQELNLLEEDVTVEAWIFWDNTFQRPSGRLSEWTIVARGSAFLAGVPALEAGEDYLLQLRSDGGVGFITGSYKDACAAFYVEADVKSGEWAHIAATLDAKSGERQVFVNGELIDSCTTSARTGIAYAGATVGGRLSKGPYAGFPGWIDEVRVSDVVRYDDDFEPSIYQYPDESTRWLLHFNDYTEELTLDTGKNETDLMEPFTGTSDSSGRGLHARLWRKWMIDDTTSACDAPGELTDTDWTTYDTSSDTDTDADSGGPPTK